MSNKIHVFTHHDLDGICSLLLLTWIFPDKEITYTTCTNASSLIKEFMSWSKKYNIKDFEQIYIFDLSLNEKDVEIIDHSNVIFVDHHKTSTTLSFKKANSFIKIFPSCVLYVYKIFKNLAKLSEEQKQLIVLVNDYDSYTNSFKNSKKLNQVFRELYKDSIQTFLNRFKEGFANFNESEKISINIAQQKYTTLLQNLVFYRGNISLQNEECIFISTFADIAINEVAEYIFHNFKNAKVAVVVNIKNERVSFRRNKKCNIDVSSLAQKLCNGGGHEAAAGGALTESFMQFSKLFTPI